MIPPDQQKEFNALYVKARKAFLSYARFHNLETETLEDIYQESVITLLQNLRNGIYQERNSMYTYLIGICKKKLLKYYEQQKKMTMESLPLTIEELADQCLEEDEKAEVLKITTRLLKETDESCRRIFTLYYRDGKAMVEIAKALRYKNEDVAKNKKSSCIRRFRHALKERLAKAGINWRTKK